MTKKTYNQAEYNRKSLEKLGKKNKLFALDADTLALFETLAKQTNQSQTDVLKSALNDYAKKVLK